MNLCDAGGDDEIDGDWLKVSVGAGENLEMTASGSAPDSGEERGEQ